MKKHGWTLLLLIIIAALAVVGLNNVNVSNSTGYITLTSPDSSLRLTSGSFFTKSANVNSNKPLNSLPTGTYRPNRVVLTADQNGSTWQLTGQGAWGKLKSLKIEPDKTTEVTFGQPLTLKADIDQSGRNLSIGYAIIGAAGEQYQTVTKDNKTLPLPKLQIIDENENVLVRGQFEYG